MRCAGNPDIIRPLDDIAAYGIRFSKQIAAPIALDKLIVADFHG